LYGGASSKVLTISLEEEGRARVSPVKLHSNQAELNEKALEALFIPTRVSLLSFNNKSGVFSNPMA